MRTVVFGPQACSLTWLTYLALKWGEGVGDVRAGQPRFSGRIVMAGWIDWVTGIPF